jgi:excisionase family DNA binding protein
VLPDPIAEPTISVERAGRLMGVSRNSAYEAARTGELPVLRVGRRLLVPTAKFLALLGISEQNKPAA